MNQTRRLTPYIATPGNRAYTLHLVRSFDNENFVANLLQASSNIRNAHAVLRALNVEFDRVRATVANEDLARIRLQFFRSALQPLVSPSSPTSKPSQSLDAAMSSLPVLDCLAEAKDSFPHVNFSPILDLLSAREAFLAYPNFTDLPDLELFAAAPHKPLLTMHAHLLPHDTTTALPPSLEHTISTAATAIGLAILLRAVPVHAASRLSYMPRGNQSATSTSSFLTSTETSRPVFRTVAQAASTHAAEATTAVRNLPRNLRPAFWPLHLATLYLSRLAKADYNPFDDRLTAGLRTTWYLAVQLRLLRARYFSW